MLDSLVADEIIPSLTATPWGSPVVVIPKQNRLCQL